MTEDKDILIVKALEAQASSQELAELQRWVDESDEHRQHLEQLRTAWNATHHYRPSAADKQQALDALTAHIRGKEIRGYGGTGVRGYENTPSSDISRAPAPPRPRTPDNRTARAWLLAAASVVVLVGLLATLRLMHTGAAELEQPLAEAQVKASVPTAKAELRLSSGETVQLGTRRLGAIADRYQQGVTATPAGTLDYSQAEAAVEVKNTVTIPRGGFYSIRLSDGTDVVLNSASELIFPAKFLGAVRRVYLKGEAFFSVAHDTQRPFVVSTEQGADIRVLGTQFNVSTYNNKVRATLVEGSIRLNAGATGQAVTLRPGQMGEYAADERQLTTANVDTYLYTAWKDGKFVFENESMEDIMARLSVWYNIDVEFADDAIRHETFTGVLSRFSDPNDILRLIEQTTAVQFSVRGSTVIVRSDGNF